jgi:hypothetical protein
MSGSMLTPSQPSMAGFSERPVSGANCSFDESYDEAAAGQMLPPLKLFLFQEIHRCVT